MRIALILALAFAGLVTTYTHVLGEKPIGWSGRVWAVFEAAGPPSELRALVEREGKLELVAALVGSDRLRLPDGATLALTPRSVTLDAITVNASRAEKDGEPQTRLVITSDGSVQRLTYAKRGEEIVFLSAMGHGMLGPMVALVDGGVVFVVLLVLGLVLLPKGRPRPERGVQPPPSSTDS